MKVLEFWLGGYIEELLGGTFMVSNQ